MADHGYGHGEPYKPAHMDEMPVPQGSWQEFYDQQQRKYTRHLIIGTTFFLFTVWVVSTFSLFVLKLYYQLSYIRYSC